MNRLALFFNITIRLFKKLKLQKRAVFLGGNSGIHGFRHVFNTNAFIVSRLFWLSIVLLSGGCLYLLMEPVDERVDDISFMPDTYSLPWTTTFPAITVCEYYNQRAAQKKLAERYPDLVGPLSFDYKKHLAALLYGRGTCGKAYCVPCGQNVSCNLPWRDIIDNVRLKCTDLISNCSYNQMPFACCDKFHVVDSEYGPCLSFNTLHSENANKESLYTVNRTTGPGMISFRLLSDAQISVHSSEELSTNDLDTKFKFDVKLLLENRVHYIFSLVEFENDPMLTLEEIGTRRCRYLREILHNPLYIYPVYSYGACRLMQDTEHSLEHCGCIHPVRHTSYKNMYCNYTGLNCLVTYEVEKVKLGIDKNVVHENCLPSCEEAELTTIHISRRWVPEESGKGASVTIQMASLPSLRFHRNLLTTNLDLVVSVGGMVGLFFGASILSIAEIIYLLLRKQ